MTNPESGFSDGVRLVVDLQRVSAVVESLSGCWEPEAIAKRATDGLVQKFDCAFARIWLLEAEQATLRLVASSGLYTHINGFFARVPMGAFKVGKIAQNRIPFLSNCLAEEVWVKDRDWAIANQITGFAGYPLTTGEKLVGVLAVFSRQPLSPEFLEVLQSLCTTLAIALEMSSHYQQEKRATGTAALSSPLSEQLAELVRPARLALVGTERTIAAAHTFLLLRLAESLQPLNCTYCRLSYAAEETALEAMLSPSVAWTALLREGSLFGDLRLMADCQGGSLSTSVGTDPHFAQVLLRLPQAPPPAGTQVRIQCRLPTVQTAFLHLAHLAGLMPCSSTNRQIPLLTDDPAQVQTSDRVLWIAHSGQPPPKGVLARLDLSTSPAQLRAAAEAAARNDSWSEQAIASPPLSEREQAIMTLLAQGLRDRDIANQLHISDRTVKFHVNNILSKLNARTRYQALHLSLCNGWLNLS